MIRGYCVMLEYWQDEAKTRECITKDRWYKTGYVLASSDTVDLQHGNTFSTFKKKCIIMPLNQSYVSQ